MISRQLENPDVAQTLYPIMQAVDMAWLDVDVAIGGIDQRKVHMLAREELPRCPLCGRVEGGEVPTSAGLVDVMAAVERGREWRPEGGPERWEAP